MMKHSRRRFRILAVCLAICVFLGACVSFLAVAEALVDRTARVLPSYAREDLSAILQKDRDDWTDDDYETLQRQTGILSRETLGEIDPAVLSSYQDALFFEGEVRHELVSFTTPHDVLYDPVKDAPYKAPIVPMQAGDIVLTSTCHTFGWRNGHAVLVLPDHRILCSVAPGELSEIMRFTNDAAIPWFCTAANFMVLRLKGVDGQSRRALAEQAESELVGIPYSLAVGIFMKKDQGKSKKGTNCSHLVWQAYYNAGYDIDTDGGPVCTSRDISMSDLLEVVQVYGFDPVSLW